MDLENTPSFNKHLFSAYPVLDTVPVTLNSHHLFHIHYLPDFSDYRSLISYSYIISWSHHNPYHFRTCISLVCSLNGLKCIPGIHTNLEGYIVITVGMRLKKYLINMYIRTWSTYIIPFLSVFRPTMQQTLSWSYSFYASFQCILYYFKRLLILVINDWHLFAMCQKIC